MNWDLLGHEWAVTLLKEHITREHVRHAYLFTGPQGAGRRTLALRFALAINCSQPPTPGEFCGKCRGCLGLAKMQHPDLAIVKAEGPGGKLKVEQVRELQRVLSLTPYDARYRIALLLNFEDANPNAANALLKTLEEPARQVILLLTAESTERLLPTIVSRCETLRLRALPLETTCRGLQEGWEIPPETARLLAHISGGRPGYALNLYQEPERMERRQRRLDDLAYLLTSGRVERFNYSEALIKEKDREVMRENLLETLTAWQSLWRDVLIRAAGSAMPPTNLDRTEEIETLADRFGTLAARQTVAAFQRTMTLLEGNINARLALEVLMLDLPYLAASKG